MRKMSWATIAIATVLTTAGCGTSTSVTAGPVPTATSTTSAARPTTTTPSTTAAATTTTALGRSRTSPVSLGTTAPIGDGWTMTVTAYTPDGTDAVLAANSFNDPPPDGKQYAIVSLQLTYTDAGTDDKSSLFDVSVQSVGPANTSYSTSDVLVVAPHSLDATKDVFKGGSVEGDVVFAVATGDADDLTLYATAGFGSDEVYFATR